MMAQTAQHPVRLQRPFYAAEAGTELHRYQDADFMARFRQDLASGTLAEPAAALWQAQDRFSRHDDTVVLRLPIHRTFYLVSCEAVCDRLGFPALDPARITSAGFVIRSVRDGKEYAWMLEDGKPLGWQPAPTEPRDPDAQRRLCPDGSVHPREAKPTYSGEETHPLHATVVRDRNGKCRTVLYGYLPLGGFHYFNQMSKESAFDSASESAVRDALARQLPWPFGLRDNSKPKWQASDARQLTDGKPTMAFFELLRMLVSRYHLGEPDIDDNAALAAVAGQIRFEQIVRRTIAGRTRETRTPSYSLHDYLERCAAHGGDNPLVRWIVEQEQALDGGGSLSRLPDPDKPATATHRTTLDYELEVSEVQAQRLRDAMLARVADQLQAKAREVPVPKFQQGQHDLYQVVPFVRALDDDGKECLIWAGASQRSRRFRVAAPFDPEASRPSLIQMPGLSDVKRGLAKGVSMITPPDTFNLINAIKFKKGVSPDAVPGEPPAGGAIQWICSFSLPVITIVAMILLMIMISLLNILFWWLPWVRICLPFPKMK